MPTPPSKAPATRARAVKERQLALVEGAGAELQAVGSREIQVDDDWEEKLNLNVKIMCVALDSPLVGTGGLEIVATLWSLTGVRCADRNVVGTVDLKTPLELKTIALHARNAEYNPKVRRRLAASDGPLRAARRSLTAAPLLRAAALLGGHHAPARPQDHGADIQLGQGASLAVVWAAVPIGCGEADDDGGRSSSRAARARRAAG